MNETRATSSSDSDTKTSAPSDAPDDDLPVAPRRRAPALALAGVAILACAAIAYGVHGPGAPGKKLEYGKSAIYYKDGASQADAEKLAAALTALHVGTENAMQLQLLREGDQYSLGYVLKNDLWNDAETVAGFIDLSETLWQQTFPEARLEVRLCDDGFVTKKRVAAGELRRQRVVDKSTFYYRGDVTDAEVGALIAMLKSAGILTPNEPWKMELGSALGGYTLGIAVADGAWNDAAAKNAFADMGRAISAKAFAGKPVEVRLCDGRMKVRATLAPAQ